MFTALPYNWFVSKFPIKTSHCLHYFAAELGLSCQLICLQTACWKHCPNHKDNCSLYKSWHHCYLSGYNRMLTCQANNKCKLKSSDKLTCLLAQKKHILCLHCNSECCQNNHRYYNRTKIVENHYNSKKFTRQINKHSGLLRTNTRQPSCTLELILIAGDKFVILNKTNSTLAQA